MVGIRYIDFTLGKEKNWYRDIQGVTEQIVELGMPDEEDLWGWGHFYRSPGTYADQIKEGFASLEQHVQDKDYSIDGVVLCGPCRDKDTATFIESVNSLHLPDCNMESHLIVEGTDCVNIIQALSEARTLIEEGAKNILVLVAEKVNNESWRFKKFSLFSDFCMALVVSSDLVHCDYEINDVLVSRDPSPGEDTSAILGRTLEKSCLNELLGKNKLPLSDISQFCYINLYEPIYQMKGKDLGFDTNKMATAMIKTQGHCYGADPFLSMLAYFDTERSNSTVLACASAKQCTGMVLISDIRK